MDVTVTTAMKDKKQIIAISKMLQDNVSSPNPEAYAGFKFHNETSYTGGHFLAVRCKSTASTCAKLPLDSTQGALMSAEVATFMGWDKYDTSNSTQTQIFSSNPSTNLVGSIALRAFLAQDRILYLEKKFFCDKATEKTVSLMVKDQFDTGSHKQVHTKKVSCQFPILEIWDLSSTNPDNLFANGWEVSENELITFLNSGVRLRDMLLLCCANYEVRECKKTRSRSNLLN